MPAAQITRRRYSVNGHLSQDPGGGGGGSAPDLTQLPTIASMNRLAADYSLNATYRALAAGERYIEPVSGIEIIRLTDASFPTTGMSFQCPYSEGGPFITRAWSGKHTVSVLGAGATGYLIDVTRSGGASGRVSNARSRASWNDVNSGFSYAAATPKRFYLVNGTRLFAYDADAPSTALNLPFIPTAGVDFTSVMNGGTSLQWLTVTDNDEWLVFQCINGSTNVVIAYEPSTGTTRTQNWSELNQPQASRHSGDNYVYLCGNNNADSAIWNHRLASFATVDPLYMGHPAPLRGGYAEWNPDDGWAFLYDPALDSQDQQVIATDVQAYIALHKSSHWINGTARDNERFLACGENENYVTNSASLSWTVDSGSVYKATPTFNYNFGTVGVTAVIQGAAGSSHPSTWTKTLTKAASRVAMVADTFYYDSGTTTLYVWLASGTPSANILRVWSGPVGVGGLVYHRGDATDGRFIAHHRACDEQTYLAYEKNAFGTGSPDGLAVMFSSNMGDAAGRVDCWLAILPEA